MKKIDLSNVNEAGNFAKLPAGGYICGILTVKDNADKEYLEAEYEIMDGEFKGYYKDISPALGFWGGVFRQSYKEKSLPFFKKFISSVEKSNSNYKFNFDEKSLESKYIGLILGEEEYINKNGDIKTRMYVSSVLPISDIRNHNFKVPELKKISVSSTINEPILGFDRPFDSDDCPF